MKKLLLLALTLVAFNANAGFNITENVQVKLSCAKQQNRPSYFLNGGDFWVDMAGDFCDNVLGHFPKTLDVRHSKGVAYSYGNGGITILKDVSINYMAKSGPVKLTIKKGRYQGGMDSAVKSSNGNNWITVNNKGYIMSLYFFGKDATKVSKGFLRITRKVDGQSRSWYLDCRNTRLYKVTK